MTQTTRWALSEPWGTLTEAEPGLFRLRLNNTEGTLTINTWILRSESNLTVIDPGWPWTLDGLQAALEAMGWTLGMVDTWLYTHTHIDHMGLAALLNEHSRAEHRTWEAVAPFAEDWHAYLDSYDWGAWGDDALLPEIRHEMESSLIMHITSSAMARRFGHRKLHGFHGMKLGDSLKVGDYTLEVHDARGHDPYHIAFFERELGWLFLGDLVLPTPTPISRAMRDDLQLYMASLDRLEKLPTQLMIPGHGVQKARVDDAFQRSRQHQLQYRALVIEALEKSPMTDLFSLAQITMGNQMFQRFWVHASLVDSHLAVLVKEGVVERFEGPRYRLA
jgi:glyoxylase-like metal-dependent hydrolase (beta-lactamase superfamily II)